MKPVILCQLHKPLKHWNIVNLPFLQTFSVFLFDEVIKLYSAFVMLKVLYNFQWLSFHVKSQVYMYLRIQLSSTSTLPMGCPPGLSHVQSDNKLSDLPGDFGGNRSTNGGVVVERTNRRTNPKLQYDVYVMVQMDHGNDTRYGIALVVQFILGQFSQGHNFHDID